MSCDLVQHVESALSALPGVTAHVDLDPATAQVHHSAAIPLSSLVAAVEDDGYTTEPTGRPAA